MLNLISNPLATIATLYSFAEERLKREEKARPPSSTASWSA